MLQYADINAAYERVRDWLLAEREPAGHWIGQLATSALSTATAVSALALARRQQPQQKHEQRGQEQQLQIGASDDEQLERLIAGGIAYLAAHQQADGGWGDTDRSFSNIATTMLAVAAFHLAGAAEQYQGQLEQAAAYIDAQGRLQGLRRRYGRDKTFAVPILTNAAVAGLASWDEVSALPFELACLPQSWYRLARLPVVSYAIPALVAIGQARFHHRPPRFLPLRWLRQWAAPASLRVLERIQPASGGYLEAVPLTSFVVMSLLSIGQANHNVTRKGLEFLRQSVRPDGSWPIDTNLATWNTTLAINALAAAGEDVAKLDCLPWLLACQNTTVHPFTGAAPGGWGWTDLSGAVPDADDTPGALLALAAWRDAPSATRPQQCQLRPAAADGLRWLLELQNRDGGWPTFCRGWGKLPFDRSGADLTAHALRALRAWGKEIEAGLFESHGVHRSSVERVCKRAFRFLERHQRSDGSWVPLWFGNQHHPAEENPVYGTTKVLLAYLAQPRAAGAAHIDTPAARGLRWLVDAQEADGGWACGTVTDRDWRAPSSIEETALAVEVLAIAQYQGLRVEGMRRALERGVAWLLERTPEGGCPLEPSPIGFYFAKLWYYEKLYPLTFAVAALGRARCALYPELPAADHGRTKRLHDVQSGVA